MKHKILKHPDKRLRKKCRSIKKITPTRRKKIEAMFELMRQSDGIGLAAPQIGWDARVFVMNTTGEPDGDLVFVNPFIMAVSEETWELEEGCLSIPGVNGIVERPQKVKVYAWNIDGKAFTAEDHGISGRCILHELDHLQGILFIDHLKKEDK